MRAAEAAATTAARRGRLWLLLAVAVQFLLLLTAFDRWIYNNEMLNGLGFATNIGGEDADIRRLYHAAVANCRASAAAEDRDLCVRYQLNMLSRLPLNYPIISGFGRILMAEYGEAPLSGQAARLSVMATLVAFGLCVLLFLAALWPLPPAAQAVSALVLTLGSLVQKALDVVDVSGGPTGGVGGTTFPVALTIGLGALALAVSVWPRPIEAAAARLSAALEPPGRVRRALWGLAAAVAVLFALRAAGAPATVVQLLALAALGVPVLALTARAGVPGPVAVLMAVLLFLMVNEDYARSLQHPKMQGFLVFAALLVYAALRPKGRLVGLMPATLLFHVASAGLVAAIIVAAEALICLVRRRLSPLLGAALATALPGVAYLLLQPSIPLFTVGVVSPAGALQRILAAPDLVQGVIGAGLLFALACLCLRRDPVWDAVARFALFAAALFAGDRIAGVFGADAATTYEAGNYVLAQAVTYSGPGLQLGAVLAIASLLACRLKPDAPAVTKAPAARVPLAGLLVAALLCVVAAKGSPISSSKGVKGILNGAAMVFAGAQPRQWGELAPAGGADDSYYLSAGQPKNSALAYFSLLKLKVRKATGAFDPAAMRIYALEEDGTRRELSGEGP